MKALLRSLAPLVVFGICNTYPLAAQRNEPIAPFTFSGALTIPGFEPNVSREPGQIATGAALHIEIIDGDGAINDIKGRIATDIIVQVEDRDHRPVAGAVVTLMSPSGGPSGTFAGGQHLVSLTTGRDGRVVAQSFRPNKLPGKFQVKVTASFHGEVATGAITQTNVAMAAAAGAAIGGGAAATTAGTAATVGLSAGVIGAIAGGIAAAVGVGVFLAHNAHSPSVTSITIAQPGSVSAGAPH
ncbi:MAG TPA: hypothetical protein VFA65_14475 [Bryobacteraceae bacterium]|nr:hypothetical protein [Bryobacteraceae bacterium]